MKRLLDDIERHGPRGTVTLAPHTTEPTPERREDIRQDLAR
jgi:hypothetical protein